jgi:hypothetical protein
MRKVDSLALRKELLHYYDSHSKLVEFIETDPIKKVFVG